MKKLTYLLAVVALFAGNSVQAQQTNANTGRGAATGTNTGSDSSAFAWGIGLASVAVIGTVVGVIAATATSQTSSFNH